MIHYETWGEGHPLLLIAPGGVNSEIAFWPRSAINPIDEFAGEFLVIGMDQRHAGSSWRAPPVFSYELTSGDQLAVLDAVGVDRAHVWGGCIGVAHALRLAQEAPRRISAVVGQDPVGLDETNSIEVFTSMFEPTIALARKLGTAAVVASGLDNPTFVVKNDGGPFARRIDGDAAFRAEIEVQSAEEYVALIEQFSAGVWPELPPLMSVEESWLPMCATLTLAGSGVPKASFTLSPSSSTSFWVALKVRVLSTSPESKVTLAGPVPPSSPQSWLRPGPSPSAGP